MSKENKTVELKEEQLEKVTGGQVGNCGITTPPKGCTQYNSAKDQCKDCPGKPSKALLR